MIEYYLKTRILSNNGHLSNLDSGKFALKLVENGTEKLILGHLSQDNNTPSIAASTVEQQLLPFKRNEDYMLSVAPVETEGFFVAI